MESLEAQIALKPLLVTEDDYTPALLRLLDHAKTSVNIMAYSFAIGSARGKLSPNTAPFEVAEKLIEIRKKRKVKIRLYIEGERETADRNTVTAQYLKPHGIQIKYGATHAKGFCIDERHILFGSTNLTQQSMTKNNETNLFIDSPDLAEGFMAYFTHLWKGGRHGEIELDPPYYADGDFKPMLIDMIRTAKKQLEFSIYFFDQKQIENALIEAHQRKVKIRGFVHNHFAFAMSYVRRSRATVRRLYEAGIKDLHFGPPHLFTHSKYLIADRKDLALGTGNWLNEDVQIHPQLYLKLTDPRLCAQLARHLQKQIKTSGQKYSPRKWS